MSNLKQIVLQSTYDSNSSSVYDTYNTMEASRGGADLSNGGGATGPYSSPMDNDSRSNRATSQEPGAYRSSSNGKGANYGAPGGYASTPQQNGDERYR
jgi:hypothetical protein